MDRHRLWRTNDAIENPEEENFCQRVFPGNMSSPIHASGIHKDDRESVRLNVETEDGNAMGMDHENVSSVCHGLLTVLFN